jgi:DNA-directed RNA polymerase subunit RPC12/RpoP
MSKRQTPRTVEAPCSTCGRETAWRVLRELRGEDYVRCTVCRAVGYRRRGPRQRDQAQENARP